MKDNNNVESFRLTSCGGVVIELIDFRTSVTGEAPNLYHASALIYEELRDKRG